MTETLKRGFPGMKSVLDMPVVQDGPPPGGFPSVRIERRLPSTGPTGVTIFALMTGCMAYGYYKVYWMMQARRERKMEVDLVRDAIHPYIMAEMDRRTVDTLEAKYKHDDEVMKNVPGWESRLEAWRTKRWIAPLPPIGIWHPYNQ